MNEQNEEPETAKLLDEIRDWFREHVVAADTVITTLMMLPAAAWGGGHDGPFVTLPRGIILSPSESGKTTAMNASVALGPPSIDADGTYADLDSALAEAANTPENPLRIVFLDEVGEVYGDDGTGRGGNKSLNRLLRKGYKRGATGGRSRGGVSRRFSIFYVVLMTGRDIAIPVDIRGRTIVMRMSAASPERYFDARESEPEAKEYSRSLGQAVRAHLEELKDFRALGLHPKLTGRKLEVWEPLLAVAYVLGGERWLNLTLDAFLELALATEQVALTPRQRVLRDLNGIISKVSFELPSGKMFAGGEALADELKHYDPDRYGDLGMTQVIARYMRPVVPRQVRVGEVRTRGYDANDIISLWEEIKPQELKDAENEKPDDPFTVVVTDDSEEVFEIPPKPRAVTESRVSRSSTTRKRK